MIRTTTIGLAVLALCGRAGASAAPATPEEAQRLTTLFERYVGHPSGTRSAVAVVPHGEGYTATLDITQMLAFTASSGLTVTAGALTTELTPQADGRWHVEVDGFPPVGIARADQSSSFVIDGYRFDGMFDPAIQAFASSTSTTRGSSTHSSGKQGAIDVKLTDAATTTMQAQAAGPGSIDVKSASSAKDMVYVMTTPAPSGAPAPADPSPAAVNTRMTVAGVETALTAAHQPIVATEDLWQFLVAHPSKAALVADQGDLKTRLKALIPLSTATTADVTLSKLAVATGLGAFGLDSFSEHYDDNGPQSKGGVFLRVALSGLTLPSGLVPAWGEPLVPKSVDLGQTYGPVDLKPALLMAIDDFDLAADKPLTDDQQAAIVAALSSGDKTLELAPSTITMPSMTVKFEGEVHLTKPLPSGAATVQATGLDRTIEAMRAVAADNQGAAQAIAALMAAKALGKAEGPDSYSWRVAAVPGGDITVNGTPLSSAAQRGKPQRKKPKLEP